MATLKNLQIDSDIHAMISEIMIRDSRGSLKNTVRFLARQSLGTTRRKRGIKTRGAK